MILSQSGSRQGRQSEKYFQNRGVATIIFLKNYGKTKKTNDKASLQNRI